MPVALTRYTVLLSGPSDVKEYWEIANEVIAKANRTLSSTTGIELYATDWQRDSRADSGAEPQALLNRQIVDDSDIVISFFKERYGTPTENYASGTEEEIKRGLEQGKCVLLYIWEPPENYVPTCNSQFSKIEELKNELGARVMYASFQDEEKLREKLTHDITKLLIDLEGRKLAPKPELSLRSIDIEGNSSDGHLRIVQEYPRSRFNSSALDERIRNLFIRIKEAPIHRPEIPSDSPSPQASKGGQAIGSMSLASINTIMPTAVSINKDDAGLVFSELSGLGLDVTDDIFYFGNLTQQSSFVSYPFGPTLYGSDDEKEKYETVQGLIEACRLKRSYNDFLNSLEGINALALGITNSGGSPARHVNVEVELPKKSLLATEDIPMPDNYFVGHAFNEGDDLNNFVEYFFGLRESSSYQSYRASAVRTESGIDIPPMYQKITNPITGSNNYLNTQNYFEALSWIYANYRFVDSTKSSTTLVRLVFDRLQQGNTYAFPAILLIHGDLKHPLQYKITADELDKPIVGTLE